MRALRSRAAGPMLLAGLGILAVIAGLALVLRTPSLQATRVEAEPEPRYPAAPAAPPAPDLPVVVAPIESVSAGFPSDEFAVDDAFALPGIVRVVYTGGIVDEHDRPIAGATVSAVPDIWTLKAAGHPLGSITWTQSMFMTEDERAELPALASYPSAVTEADGRFRIAMPQAAHASAPPNEPNARLRPELVVRCPGYQAVARVCPDALVERGGDIGDVMLAAGVTILGRTLDESGQPIAGVEIDVWVSGAPTPPPDEVSQNPFTDPARALQRATSDVEGRFVLDGLAVSSDFTQLRFNPIGRVHEIRQLILEAGVTNLGDVILERGPWVAGRVLDELGRPLVGAEVRVAAHHAEEWTRAGHRIDTELYWARLGRPVGCTGGLDDTESKFGVTSTDGDGRFQIGGLRKSDYDVYAVAPGYEPQGHWRVVPGAVDLVFQLQRRSALRVRLIDAATSTPLADASLRVIREVGIFPAEGEDLRVSSDPDWGPNVFLVEDVCPSKLAAVVESASHGRQILPLNGLALGAPIEERTLHVGYAASLAGRVVGTDGSVLSDVAVSLFADGEQGLGLIADVETRSDADGRFVFRGLTPAEYSIRLARAGLVPRQARASLEPGEDLVEDDLVLVRTGRVEGVVTDTLGAGYFSVAARSCDHTGGYTDPHQCGLFATGPYAMEVSPGAWSIEVTYDSERGKLARYVEVASGETTRVDFELLPLPTLTGRVTLAGTPVPGARVCLRPKVGQAVETDSEGRYALVIARGVEGGVRARSPRGGLTREIPVQIAAGQSGTMDLVLGSGSVRGQVVDDATGMPVAGAMIHFTASRWPDAAPTLETDAAGRFVVGDVDPGEWSLMVSHDRYLSMEKWLHVTVPETGEAPDLVIPLERGATITGVVRTSGGAPTAHVRQVSALKDGEQHYPEDTETKDGAFEIVQLEPGRYTLYLTRVIESMFGNERKDLERMALATTVVDVRVGDNVVVDLVLPPGDT